MANLYFFLDSSTVRGQDINVRGLNGNVLGFLGCDPSQEEKRPKVAFRGTSAGRKPLERVDCQQRRSGCA